jgi:hypothetical protein
MHFRAYASGARFAQLNPARAQSRGSLALVDFEALRAEGFRPGLIYFGPFDFAQGSHSCSAYSASRRFGLSVINNPFRLDYENPTLGKTRQGWGTRNLAPLQWNESKRRKGGSIEVVVQGEQAVATFEGVRANQEIGENRLTFLRVAP